MKFVLRSGFSLVEMLVVMTILAILAGIVIGSTVPAQKQARDAERQANLREVQSALELYKQKWGRYPEGCRSGSTLPAAPFFSGQVGSRFECPSGTNQYIVGTPDRPFSEFLVNLPQEESLPSNDSGYAYVVDETGGAYKFMARKTVEADERLRLDPTRPGLTNAEVIDIFDQVYSHPFKICDVTFDVRENADLIDNFVQSCSPPNPIASGDPRYGCDIGICDRMYGSNSYSAPRDPVVSGCMAGDPLFQTSYAVWGGTVRPTDNQYRLWGPDDQRYVVRTERNTERIICDTRAN